MGTQTRKFQAVVRVTGGTVAALVALTFFSSCATPGRRTGIGAGAGAATGAAIGGIAGGWKGAGIGALAGGLLGGGIGNYLDKQADELEQVASTKRTEDGILVNLKNDLLFDTGSASLRPEAVTNLIQLGDILSKYDQDRIRIQGYTDNVGAVPFNENLSQRRAEAVKNVLVSRGVRPEQMLTLGFGDKQPIASNRTANGRAMNRRVELHIDVPNQKAG